MIKFYADFKASTPRNTDRARASPLRERFDHRCSTTRLPIEGDKDRYDICGESEESAIRGAI